MSFVRIGIPTLLQEIAQGQVDLVFANVVRQRVHYLAALLIPNVRLVLHQHHRTFLAGLARAAAQVSVEFILQKPAHVLRTVLLLHHHQRGILGQRFRHHVGAFHPPANQLMRPPLMPQLMSGNEVGEVDVGWLFHPADEADSLGKRDRIRKRLRKTAIPRELQNPVLLELEWAEILLVVSQTRFRSVDHIVDVVSVRGVMIDLDGDRIAHSLVHFALHCIVSRDERDKVQHLHIAHVVGEIVTPAVVPFLREIARRQRDLVVRSAHGRAVANPVRLSQEDIGARAGRVATRRQLFLLGELLFAPASRVADFHILVIADAGKVAGVEERPGVGEFGRLVTVLEPVGLMPGFESKVHNLAGRKWRVKLVNTVESARRGRHQFEGLVEADVGHRLLDIGQMDPWDRRVRLVLQNEVPGSRKRALFRENVNIRFNRGDLGLRQPLVLLEITLIAGLDRTALLRC